MSDPFVARIAKELGEKSVSFLAERPPLDAVSTGSVALNATIGPYCPGIPLGRLSQILGSEGSGKSLLCCQILAEAQARGLATFLIDRERHYTSEWFERFGGDAEKVYDLQPATTEDGFAMVEEAAKFTGENFEGGIFVIDSLQSLPTATQFEADTGSSEGLAAQARFLSARLGRYVEHIDRGHLGLIVVGQIRDNPSPFARLDDRQYSPGGNALKHYSVLRLEMHARARILEKDPDSGEEYGVGFTSSVEVVKNDVGGMAPRKVVELDFRDGTGSDDTHALFRLAKTLGIVEQSGAWYSVPIVGKKFQGKDNWVEFVKEHPALVEEITRMAFDPEIVLPHEAERVLSRGE